MKCKNFNNLVGDALSDRQDAYPTAPKAERHFCMAFPIPDVTTFWMYQLSALGDLFLLLLVDFDRKTRAFSRQLFIWNYVSLGTSLH